MGDQWEQGIKGNVGGPMRWGTNEFKQCGGDLWIGDPAGEKGPMRWGTNEMGDQWNGRCVGANWGTNGIGDQWEWDGGPLGLAEIGWMNEKGDQYVVGDLWIGGQWEGDQWVGDQWDGGPMSRGDQWDGGPMEWVMHGCQLGDQWDGRLMSWGTNEMGNQWDGGPMRWRTIGIGRWWGDEWKGGPMRWGTSDMGDQWDGGPMSSNNVLGDQWVGGPMRRGPMRWGTNEMGDQWADPLSCGVSGKIFNVIRSMYNTIKTKVFSNGIDSDPYFSYLGVRQGECLSPFLFSMYLNDLEEYLLPWQRQGYLGW